VFGIYLDNNNNELVLAMQPDAGGRKLLFLDAVSGGLLGHAVLTVASYNCSNLSGMLIEEAGRGRALSKVFVQAWLQMCQTASVETTTSRIRKPLLALTLLRLGFTPILPGKGIIETKVSKGADGSVVLWASDGKKLREGFGETEIRSQNLAFGDAKSEGGKVIQLRARYRAPEEDVAVLVGLVVGDAEELRRILVERI